ncbi:hypothetical protein, partial [Aeribacillus composti]|uniref:hypothetical protein n=1 Tax=Aeribacillus composti TaxID=1868734 RepID=UPI003D211698
CPFLCQLLEDDRCVGTTRRLFDEALLVALPAEQWLMIKNIFSAVSSVLTIGKTINDIRAKQPATNLMKHCLSDN